MRLENVYFLPVEAVESIHTEALLLGGVAGTLDRNILLSAVETPKTTFDGKPLYGSLAEIAATYAWGIARNHPFMDGNKRTALMTALLFLEMNGHPVRTTGEWVELMVRLAADATFQRSELVTAFIRLLGDDEAVT